MSEWQPIESLPETEFGKSVSVLFYSKSIGVKTGEAVNFQGYRHASVACYHGNAIEQWGVTHWMPLPPGPDIEHRA